MCQRQEKGLRPTRKLGVSRSANLIESLAIGAPRWLYTPVYLALGWVAVFYLGALLRLPQWLLDASPVNQTKTPAEYSAVALGVMVVVAVLLTLVAGAIYRRRDAI